MMLYVQKIDDYLKVFPDDEVKNFVVIMLVVILKMQENNLI